MRPKQLTSQIAIGGIRFYFFGREIGSKEPGGMFRPKNDPALVEYSVPCLSDREGGRDRLLHLG